jgi:hypothetical protein
VQGPHGYAEELSNLFVGAMEDRPLVELIEVHRLCRRETSVPPQRRFAVGHMQGLRLGGGEAGGLLKRSQNPGGGISLEQNSWVRI